MKIWNTDFYDKVTEIKIPLKRTEVLGDKKGINW